MEALIFIMMMLLTVMLEAAIPFLIRKDIQDGDVLPSVRSLAADLGVNMHTVNKSYHELEKKGLIQIIPKSGAVIRTANRKLSEEEKNRTSDNLKPTIVEALVLGMNEEDILSIAKSIIQNLKEE